MDLMTVLLSSDNRLQSHPHLAHFVAHHDQLAHTKNELLAALAVLLLVATSTLAYSLQDLTASFLLSMGAVCLMSLATGFASARLQRLHKSVGA